MASRLLKSLLSGQKKKEGKNNGDDKGFGSTRLFALKESRWFKREEANLFQNVLDAGYVIELRIACDKNGPNVNKDAAATLEYGIVLWKKKNAGEKKEPVVIHLARGVDSGKKLARELRLSSLEGFWQDGTEIRINNMSDGKVKADNPSKITERVTRASKGCYKWMDSYYLVHWCRYGNPIPVEEVTKKKKELHQAAVRWGSVSASAGALLYLSKNQCQNRNAYRKA